MTRIILIVSLLFIQLFSQENKKEETLELKNSALVLIEYQNEWLSKNSKLDFLMKDKQQFKDSVIASKKVLAFARKIGMPIIHVPLIVSDDYREFGKEKAKYGLRAVIQKVGTWQGESRDFHEDFKPLKNEFIVSGRVGASAFAGSNLEVILNNNEIKNLYFIGYATNVCVESSFRQAHDLGYNAYVIDDATSAFTKEQKEFFLKEIVHHFGTALKANAFVNLKVKN